MRQRSRRYAGPGRLADATKPSTEALIKVYADYARNYDNAKLPSGSQFSAFDTEAWPLEERPMPPRGLRLRAPRRGY